MCFSCGFFGVGNMDGFDPPFVLSLVLPSVPLFGPFLVSPSVPFLGSFSRPAFRFVLCSVFPFRLSSRLSVCFLVSFISFGRVGWAVRGTCRFCRLFVAGVGLFSFVSLCRGGGVGCVVSLMGLVRRMAVRWRRCVSCGGAMGVPCGEAEGADSEVGCVEGGGYGGWRVV